MMRTLILALAIALTVDASPIAMSFATSAFAANPPPKPVVAKRCGSRGGIRKSRSYYGYGC